MALLDRIFRRNKEEGQRAVDVSGGLRHDMLDPDAAGHDAAQRRATREAGDWVALSTAIYSAVSRRTRALGKPTITVVEQNSDGTMFRHPLDHPALQALRRGDGSTRGKAAMRLLGQHRLLYGSSLWLKRKVGDQTTEFEIVVPHFTVNPDKKRPWIPAGFTWHAGGKRFDVDAADCIYTRYLVDPRNSLYGIAPIPAARLTLETGVEAARANRAMIDNDSLPKTILAVEEGSAAEVERIQQQLEREFKGADKRGRTLITEGGLKEVVKALSPEDMQWMDQQRWGVEEIGRAYEMSPVLLGDMRQATKENLNAFLADMWSVVQDDLDALLDEYTEQFLVPEYGQQFRFVADYHDIPHLQRDHKLQAEIDEIDIRSRKVTVNELRQRDNKEPLDWGNDPLVPSNMMPISEAIQLAQKIVEKADTPDTSPSNTPLADDGGRSLASLAVASTRRAPTAGVLAHEAEAAVQRVQRAIEKVLDIERKAIVANIASVDEGLSGDYERDWSRHRETLEGPLAKAHEAYLAATGYVDPDERAPAEMLPAVQLAIQYASRRAGELLALSGPDSLVVFTLERVQVHVTEALTSGRSIRDLKNALRADLAFSATRAETVARTEAAFAQSDATIKSFRSQGTEGKEWRWPGGQCEAGICDRLDGEVVAVDEAFSTGDMAPPAHPRCTCNLLPVRNVNEGRARARARTPLRKIVKEVERDPRTYEIVRVIETETLV